MKLTEVVSQFMLDLEVKGRTKSTLVDYRHRLGILLQLLQDHCQVTELEDIKIVHLRQVVQHLLTDEHTYRRGRPCGDGKTMAPSTVRAFVSVFKSFFHWCYLEDLVGADPAGRLASPKVPVRVVPAFHEKHIEMMLEACDITTPLGYRDYVMLLLLLDTGMRVGELLGLKVADVHDRFVKVFGKGRREREIGIHPEVSKLLWKYIHKYRHPVDLNEPLLFLGKGGKPLHFIGVQGIIKRIQHRSGLDNIKFTPHVFRHTFAKMYLDRGGDLFKLSRELGHSRVEITKKYLEDFHSTEARKDHTAFSPIVGVNLKKNGRSRKK